MFRDPWIVVSWWYIAFLIFLTLSSFCLWIDPDFLKRPSVSRCCWRKFAESTKNLERKIWWLQRWNHNHDIVKLLYTDSIYTLLSTMFVEFLHVHLFTLLTTILYLGWWMYRVVYQHWDYPVFTVFVCLLLEGAGEGECYTWRCLSTMESGNQDCEQVYRILGYHNLKHLMLEGPSKYIYKSSKCTSWYNSLTKQNVCYM